MKLLRVLCICVFVCAGIDWSQAQGVSVQLKVRESKLFGLKGERFATFELASRSRALPLSDDSVNAGPFYVFLFRPAGDWSLDADFVQEEIPKLVLLQNDQTIQIGWKSDIVTDTGGTSILVGYPKSLKLNQPFTVRFGLDGESSKATVAVPEEYWPGRSALTQNLHAADTAIAQRRYHDAIAIYESLIRADSLKIFPQSREFGNQRSRCFESIISDAWSEFQSATQTPSTLLKERISHVDLLTPQVQFVLDSLTVMPGKISTPDSSANPLIGRARTVLAKMKAARDSLQRAQDDATVRWISEGAATGKNGPQFERMIEILTYAFSSLDFTDTTIHPLNITITPEAKSLLQKYNLQESYDIFVRQASERFQKRLPPFPPGFLTNLQKDTSLFPLPFYHMLKAVQDYYSGAGADALDAIRLIFRTCYDAELSRRFDNMRVLINLRSRPDRTDLLGLLGEAAQADSAGNNDLASERYTSALRLAPDCAYPSYLLGRLFARTGDPIRARSFFERAYVIDSLYLSAYRDAWTLCESSGNYKAMIEVLTRALSKGNDFWETNTSLGIAYLGDGSLHQAIIQFERALELNPNNYQTNVQLGLAYQTAKNYQKARDYFNKAIFIDPHRLEAVASLQKLDELQKAGR